MIPIHRYEASSTSVGSSRRGLKRSFSSEHVSSSADKPAVKKPRPQKQCYPGGHIGVWHESSQIFEPEEALRGTAVEAKVTAEYHQPAQQLQSCISLTPDRGLLPTQDTPGFVITPVYNDLPSCGATYFEQWSNEPVTFLQSPPTATNLSLSTYNPTPPVTFLSTAYEKWAEICSNTLLSPETWVNSNPKPLLETQSFTCPPNQLEGGELHNDWLNLTYQEPTSYFAGLFDPDSCYHPWTASNDLAMGGGEHFPTSNQVQGVFPGPEPLSKPEEECEQLAPEVHHESWPPQQLGLTHMPNYSDWTDSEIPAQPLLQQALHSCPSPIQPLGKGELCLDEAPYDGQMSHGDLLMLPGSQQSSQDPQHTVSRADEEEILTVSEDSQDTGAQCTCSPESSDPNPPCPSCTNSPRSWVMVTYRLKPPGEIKKPPKPRKRLEEDARRQTSQTREIGACVRCKIQRVRCIPDSEDPAGPCEACSRVAQNYSRKVLHHIPCHRYKLQEVVLFRTSGSRVTDRWHSAQVRNVMTYGKTISVQMLQDCVDIPFEYEVRKVAKTGRGSHHDKTMREWYDGTDVRREPVPDYALADVHQTMTRYKDYIRISVLGDRERGCQPVITKLVEDYQNTGQGIVGEVFKQAWAHFCSLPSASETWDFFYRPPPKKTEEPRPVSEKGFLLGFFELRFALRHATGWSWILEGGIPSAEPIKNFPPLEGRIGTPRLAVGQIDCIRIACVLKPLTKSLLKVLMAWIADRQYDRWMSIFFATFILLSELAKATEDAYHHGWYDKDLKGNGPKNAHIIRDIHESANIILAHWHYFNCSTDPWKLKSEKQKNARSKTPLRALTPEQLTIVQELWLGIQKWRETKLHDDELYDKKTEKWWTKWCHSLYFADQMFDTSWKPRQVFS